MLYHGRSTKCQGIRAVCMVILAAGWGYYLFPVLNDQAIWLQCQDNDNNLTYHTFTKRLYAFLNGCVGYDDHIISPYCTAGPQRNLVFFKPCVDGMLRNIDHTWEDRISPLGGSCAWPLSASGGLCSLIANPVYISMATMLKLEQFPCGIVEEDVEGVCGWVLSKYHAGWNTSPAQL